MAEIIDARFRFKVATEAEWLTNTLPLLNGEAAIVRRGDGMPVNLKFGDGGKTFSELPYFIQYDQAAYVAYTATPTQPVAYTIVGEGTYGAITVGEGNMAVLGWNGTTWAKDNEVDLPTTPIANEVIEGGIEATSQDAVYQFAKPVKTIETLNYTPYRVDGKGYDSSGNEITTPSQSIIKDMPIDVTKTHLYINNTYNDPLYKYFFKNSLGEIVGSVGYYNSVNMVIPIPSGSAVFCTTLFRNATGQLKPDYSITYNPLSSDILTEAFGAKIEAKQLSNDNVTPSPTSDDNAVNLGYFNTNAVKDSDLTISEIVSEINHLDRDFIVNGFYISSAGEIIAGQPSLAIVRDHPCADYAGQTVTFSGYNPVSTKKLVFRDDLGAILGGVLSLTTNPFTTTIPIGAATFDMSVKQGSDSIDSYDEVMFNMGATQLPYEPHREIKLTKIKGYDVSSSGGEAYDQSLNTNDNVEFNTVKTGVLDMTSWIVNLPEGAGTPPVDVAIGDAWVDTTSDIIKVRRS